MAEYIKRETAVKVVEKYGLTNGVAWGRHTGLAICIASEIVDIPAADVAPVVRCKNCKYSCKDRNGRTCEGYWYELSEFAVPVKDDDFCSYGERKENNLEKV